MMRFDVKKFLIQATRSIYVFCIDIGSNSNYFLVQH